MSEIEVPKLLLDFPFRRPSGVVIREIGSSPRSSLTSSMSIPATRSSSVLHSSPGPSSSYQPPSSGQSMSIQDIPTSELTDILYARLLSQSSPEDQDKDLLSLLRNFQPQQISTSTSTPIHIQDPRVSTLITSFETFKSEVNWFKSKVKDEMKEIKDGIKLLTNVFQSFTQKFTPSPSETCQAAAGPSNKRSHDHDDPDHQGHDGRI